MSPIVGRQVVFPDVGCLYGDAVPGPDRLDVIDVTVGMATLPDAFPDECFRPVIGAAV